jgi:hypothetical protein
MEHFDLDEIKKKYKRVKSPEAPPSFDKTSNKNHDYHNKEEDTMNQFLTLLKTRDRENKKFLGIFYIVMVFVYAGLFLLAPSEQLSLLQRLGGLALAASFSLLAVYFKNEHSKLSRIDYDSSTLDFLNAAEERFTFLNKRRLSYMVPIFVLIDLGLFLLLYAGFGERVGLLPLLLWYHLVWAVLLGFGVSKGIHVHRKKNVPILEQVRALKKTFTGDNHEDLEPKDAGN